MGTVGSGITIRKTKAVGLGFSCIYETNKIKYETIKLTVNDNFYVFQKTGTVRRSIIIRNTVSVGMEISRPGADWVVTTIRVSSLPLHGHPQSKLAHRNFQSQVVNS